MKKILFIICSCFSLLNCFSQNLAVAKPAFEAVLNQYGEVKTSIYHASSIQGFTTNILKKNKEALVTKLGEGMYYELLNHSNMTDFPAAYNTIRTFLTDEATLLKYNVYFIAYFDGYVALRVPYKENSHMPANWLASDKTDFYFIVFDNSVANVRECIKAAINTADKYPESLTARNLSKTEVVVSGTEEFNKGSAEEKAANYKEAIEWYKKSAAKGNSAAMYNIGFLYYENKTGEGYTTNSVLEGVISSETATTKRYIEAVKWFKQSAEKNNEDAMYAVGLMYLNGEGVTENKSEAKKWFQKAADKGHVKAKEKVKLL